MKYRTTNSIRSSDKQQKYVIRIYPVQYLECIYTNAFFVTYLKTKFDQAFCKFAEFGYTHWSRVCKAGIIRKGAKRVKLRLNGGLCHPWNTQN